MSETFNFREVAAQTIRRQLDTVQPDAPNDPIEQAAREINITLLSYGIVEALDRAGLQITSKNTYGRFH